MTDNMNSTVLFNCFIFGHLQLIVSWVKKN